MDFAFLVGLKGIWKLIIWGLRLSLFLFIVLGAGLEVYYSIPFFTSFARDHTTITSALFFLGTYAFLGSFVKIKKQLPYGGETVMKKFTAVMGVIVAAVLGFAIVSLAYPGLVTETLMNIGNGAGAYIIDSFYSACDMIGTVPNALAIGITGTALTAVLIHNVVAPRITKTEETKPQYMGAPASQTPIASAQPVQQVVAVAPEKKES
jgi:hypothetical protein